MVNVGHYLNEYLKINTFFAYAAGFLFFLAALKFFRKPAEIKSSKKIFLIIVVIGLLLRLFWLSFSTYEPKSSWNHPPVNDNDLIHISAVDITHGVWMVDQSGTPTGRRPVGYPMFLACLYKIFGVKTFLIWASNLILYLISIYFLYRLAELAFSSQVAILSALLFALFPTSIYTARLVTDETLFIPLWYAGIYLLLNELHGSKIKFAWLWYGVLFGYAAMTRTYAIFMPAVVALAYLLKRNSLWKSVGIGLLTLLVMQLVNLPWAIRNYRVWGVPVVYAVAGHSIYAQTNPMAAPEGVGRLPVKGEPGYSEEFDQAMHSGNEGLIQKTANAAMFHWIKSEPADFFKLGVSKLLFFMHWGRAKGVWPLHYQFEDDHVTHPLSKGQSKTLEELSFGFYYIIFHAFLASLILIILKWKRFSSESQKSILVLGSCVFCWLGLHLVIMPDPKYRFPIEPLMMIGAAFALNVFYGWVFAKPQNGSVREVCAAA